MWVGSGWTTMNDYESSTSKNRNIFKTNSARNSQNPKSYII